MVSVERKEGKDCECFLITLFLSDHLGLAQASHRFTMLRGILSRSLLRLKHSQSMMKKHQVKKHQYKRETAR